MAQVDIHLYAGAVLLPHGWSEDVRLTLSDGIITAVEAGVARQPLDEMHGAILPGMHNLSATLSSGAWQASRKPGVPRPTASGPGGRRCIDSSIVSALGI